MHTSYQRVMYLGDPRGDGNNRFSRPGNDSDLPEPNGGGCPAGCDSNSGNIDKGGGDKKNGDEEFPTLGNTETFIIIWPNSNDSKSVINCRPTLLVAKTIAHEVIHAEMFRKLMSLTQEPNFDGFTRQEIINLLSNGDYPGIYEYYRTYKTNWSHQQMADYYRETIADMLADYDNQSHTYDFYMDLAWEGLVYDDIPTWSNKSDKEKKRIKNVILDYIDNNKYQGCQE